MSGTIKIPEPGVDESKWLVVGPAQFILLREQNKKLLDMVTDLLDGHEKVYPHERWACMEQAVLRTVEALKNL